MQRLTGSRQYIVLFLFLFLVSACSMGRVLKHDAQARSKHTACVTCHRSIDPSSSGASLSFADNIDPSSICLDCHHYESNHHPVNAIPGKEYAKSSMRSFPLFEGQVRCLTCHQAHSDPGQNKLNEPTKLLRGGPYADLRELCFKCHYQETYAEINPHVMRTSDNNIRDVNGKPVCLLCHSEKPDPQGDPADVRFRADVAFLCWRCHASMMGTFMGKHFHVKPKRATRTALQRTEQERDIVLPLANDGMLTCSTCHNPHQQGIIVRVAAAAGADAPRRLRMSKEAICSACHRQ
ncbi:MAG: hypothetical protein A2X58_05650 [Nitrospirae bacterium GWC2_56_14]|nr:MAG: hypothetical protein A2X58_05650 [Nitrospirae bacterium GWC2_56_14]HBB67311.1 hypothetical protein [Elusimicrobiota bacterium]